MVIFGQICPNLAKKRNFYGVHGVHGGHRITPLDQVQLTKSFQVLQQITRQAKNNRQVQLTSHKFTTGRA